MPDKLLITFIVCLFGGTLFCQSLNTNLRSSWDDPTLSSGFVKYNDIWGYADDNGREYAILGSLDFTIFIDITDPDNPVEVDRIAGGSSCTWRDFKVYGHYAYGVADNCDGGLEIFDLSNLPISVTKVYDDNEFLNDTHNLFIDTSAGKLYGVGFRSSERSEDIVILDIATNPEVPQLIRGVELPNASSTDDYVHDIYVRNDTAFCSQGFQGFFHVYDLTDVETLIFDDLLPFASIETNGYTHSNWLSDDGNTLVICDENNNRPVIVADFSTKTSITQTSTIKSTLLAPEHTNSIAHNPFIINNDFVAISYYDDGLQIYRIDDANAPFRAGYYDTDTITTSYNADGAWGIYPYLPSGNIIGSDVTYGLFVITPEFPLADCLSDVAMSGTYDHTWEVISKDSMNITASYLDNAMISFKAPQKVKLSGDFLIEAGSTLEVHMIDRCGIGQNKPIQIPSIPRFDDSIRPNVGKITSSH